MSVAISSPDDASSACPRCRYFLADLHGGGRFISCPDCLRRIADVSDAIRRISTPLPLLERIPESVARENTTIAFSGSVTELVVLSDIASENVNETVDKLRFILNISISVAHAEAAAIRQAIIRDYGPADTDDWLSDGDLLDSL